MPYLRRLNLRQKIRYFYNFYLFSGIYKKDRKRIEAWQEMKLRELIPVLETNISLFRKILKSAGIASSDIRTLADLAKLPVTNKDTFRNVPVAEYTTSTAAPVGSWVTTSGT